MILPPYWGHRWKGDQSVPDLTTTHYSHHTDLSLKCLFLTYCSPLKILTHSLLQKPCWGHGKHCCLQQPVPPLLGQITFMQPSPTGAPAALRVQGGMTEEPSTAEGKEARQGPASSCCWNNLNRPRFSQWAWIRDLNGKLRWKGSIGIGDRREYILQKDTNALRFDARHLSTNKAQTSSTTAASSSAWPPKPQAGCPAQRTRRAQPRPQQLLLPAQLPAPPPRYSC